MDILTIEIDSDTDFSDGNNDYRDPAAEATAPLSPAKIWTDFEKNAFFKSVKVEFGAMLNNNENISNPWKTIIERLHKSQYSMYSLKELLKVWRKIRMDAHLHENNNAMFGTPLDIEVNRLIKLLHTIKEAKRTSKLTSAKSVERLEDKHDSKPKNTCKSKPAAPEKKKRKKRPLTLSKVKKDKKPKLALPPLDPNRLEEDKEGAEKTEWSEKEQRDLVSIVETTGNEVFKPDVPKQFWSNVRTKMIEKGHNERSVGALYYKWNRLLESAKLAWADQKAKNSLDQAVIEFLTELIKSNVKKPYGPEENDGISASRPSSLSGEILKDSQQSELHSVDQNKSDKMLISNKSSVNNENSELYKTIQENKQENVENEVVEQETEDDGSESEDEYVSAADILKM
ncbi:unnamed protein product [Callosobruchus maculatus]|uniref:Myb-like domain-containing protein n=1 Tax=Callosobruchus maculatus TaxID=64391 RepID=A0A653D0K8_CALMS|nr:unnamed protein product [Callosobruchus maculatus]